MKPGLLRYINTYSICKIFVWHQFHWSFPIPPGWLPWTTPPRTRPRWLTSSKSPTTEPDRPSSRKNLSKLFLEPPLSKFTTSTSHENIGYVELIEESAFQIAKINPLRKRKKKNAVWYLFPWEKTYVWLLSYQLALKCDLGSKDKKKVFFSKKSTIGFCPSNHFLPPLFFSFQHFLSSRFTMRTSSSTMTQVVSLNYKKHSPRDAIVGSIKGVDETLRTGCPPSR